MRPFEPMKSRELIEQLMQRSLDLPVRLSLRLSGTGHEEDKPVDVEIVGARWENRGEVGPHMSIQVAADITVEVESKVNIALGRPS